MAENCCALPSVIDGAPGETVMDTSTGAMTVKVVLPDVPPKVAVIVVLPAPTEVASPCVPAALLIVATAVAEDDHVERPVRSSVEPSEYMPVAVNACVLPVTIEGAMGEIAIDISVADLTVNVALPLLPPNEAVMLALPAPIPVARPCVPMALLTVATIASDEAHVTIVVKFCVEPSE